MANIIHEIGKLIKGITLELANVRLINARVETLRKIMAAINDKLNAFAMEKLPQKSLCDLETRLHELRSIFLRLQFRRNAEDVEKLHIWVQTRLELPLIDIAMGRLRGGVGFLNLLDKNGPHYNNFSEKKREADVLNDQREMVKYISELFPYKREKFGVTAEQIRLVDELADFIHENEIIKYKSAQFLQKIDPKARVAAKATVDLVDAIYLENNLSTATFKPIVSNFVVKDLKEGRGRRRTIVAKAVEPEEVQSMVSKNMRNLGRGRYGDVLGSLWKGRRVALKPMPDRDLLSLQARAELRNHALLWQSEFEHDNIAELFGFMTYELTWYMIIEETHMTLYTLLHELQTPEVLDAPSRNAIIRGVARGLKYLHDGNMLHRNLKPSNILVGEDTTDYRQVKLSGFGMALAREEVPGNVYNKNTRYLLYCAPEAQPGHRVQLWSGAADVYSLGIIMWEVCQVDLFPFEGVGNVTRAVVADNVRPQFGKTGSDWLRHLAVSCWDLQVYARPRSSIVVAVLEQNIKAIDDNRAKARETLKRRRTAERLRKSVERPPASVAAQQTARAKEERRPATMMDALESKIEDEGYVAAALASLVEASKEQDRAKREEFNDLLNYKDPMLLLYQAMNNFPKNARIQANAFLLARTVLVSGKVKLDKGVKEIELTKKCVIGMNVHKQDKVLQFFAVLLLGTLAQRSSWEYKKAAFDMKVAQSMVNSLQLHPVAELLHRYSFWAIGIFLLDSDTELKQQWCSAGLPTIVLKSMKTHQISKDVQTYGLGVLINLLNKSKETVHKLFLARAYVNVIASMKKYPQHPKIQEYGCVLIAQFSLNINNAPDLLKAGALSVLFKALSEDLPDVEHTAWKALHTLCNSETCLPYIVDYMKSNENHMKTQLTGCTIVTHLGKVMERKAAFLESGCLAHIIKTLEVFAKVPVIAAKGCVALNAICTTQGNCLALVRGGGIEVVLVLMKTHAEENKVQVAALGVLASLVEVPTEQNGKFLQTKYTPGPLHQRNAIQNRGAASEIMIAMVNNYSDDKIQVKGLWILSELALWIEAGDSESQEQTEETELLDLEMVEIIEVAISQHPNNVTVQAIGLETVARLAYNDPGKDIIRQRPFNFMTYATECLESFGDFPEVVTSACRLMERLALCASCRNEHYQFNQQMGNRNKTESFLWANNMEISFCNRQCVTVVQPASVRAVILALLNNRGVHKRLQTAASDALRSFCIASKILYQYTVEILLLEDEVQDYLAWFSESEAFQYWDKVMTEKERSIPKKTIMKKRGKRNRGSRTLSMRHLSVTNVLRPGARRSRNRNHSVESYQGRSDRSSRKKGQASRNVLRSSRNMSNNQSARKLQKGGKHNMSHGAFIKPGH